MRVVEWRLAFSSGGAFAKMSPTEREYLQIVKLAVVKYSPSFFRYASNDVQQNRDFIPVRYIIPTNGKIPTIHVPPSSSGVR